MAGPSATRRNPKGERRRAEILDATITLAATHGLEAATMQRVADAAGVRKSLVLYHFGGRAGLLTGVLQRCGAVVEERRTAALEVAGGDPRERLRAWIDARFADELALHAWAVLLQTGARLAALPGGEAVQAAQARRIKRLAELLSRGNRAFTWQVPSAKRSAATIAAMLDGACVAALRQGDVELSGLASRARRLVFDQLIS